MGELNISINNRPFQIACDDGDEPRVTRLAEDLAARISQIKQAVGEAGDARLLVMAGLTLCDELRELREDINKVQKTVLEASDARAKVEDKVDTLAQNMEQTLIASLQGATTRLDTMFNLLNVSDEGGDDNAPPNV